MTRWRVGDKLLGEIDGAEGYPQGLEIRTVEGSYWHYEGQTWTALTGPAPHLTSVSSTRLFDGDRPAVVTYAPPLPEPHTEPGNYVCQGSCGYRFYLAAGGVWEGPWDSDQRQISSNYRTWEQMEEDYGDCARNLVGPVPSFFLKGL